eukprot:2014837-Amphidinium_carterae.1
MCIRDSLSSPPLQTSRPKQTPQFPKSTPNCNPCKAPLRTCLRALEVFLESVDDIAAVLTEDHQSGFSEPLSSVVYKASVARYKGGHKLLCTARYRAMRVQ